jgi:DNA-directed RNA polymerase subunit RPC12/RpoP
MSRLDERAIYECSTCREPYWFVSGGGGMQQDHEDYHCPHCGAHEGRERTAGVPHTRPLTPDEYADWKEKQKAKS